MNHNGEKTILPLLILFLPLHTMNLVNTVIAMKLIGMCIFGDDIDDQCVVNAHFTETDPDPSTINVPKAIN
jgi:hypothetical protein